MQPRTAAALFALGRVAVGGAFAAAPGRLGATWIGADAERPGARVMAVAFAGRDLGLGLGVLGALRDGYGARGWLRAGVLADAGDLVATLRARDQLPPAAVAGVSVVAAGALIAGLWLQSAVE